jgi:hypothetical protein
VALLLLITPGSSTLRVGIVAKPTAIHRRRTS